MKDFQNGGKLFDGRYVVKQETLNILPDPKKEEMHL
jgi:hypothetical protein